MLKASKQDAIENLQRRKQEMIIRKEQFYPAYERRLLD
jgi:hypothetical protein